MAKFERTPSQKKAIEHPECPMLVSAAAGSGKTSVLTDRLLYKIQNGENIDNFLVITFTRAAAAELRGRILEKLSVLCAEQPENAHLRRQTGRLFRAGITTIDAWCVQLLRENTHLADVAPGFSVLEEERAADMRRRAVNDVLEKAYESIETDAAFRTLTDTVGAGRDDSRLEELLLSLYLEMQSRPRPRQWAQEVQRLYDTEETDAGQTLWGRALLEDTAAEAEYLSARLEKALGRMAGDEKMRAAYEKSFDEVATTLRGVARLARSGHWDRTREEIQKPWPKLGALRNYPDEARKEQMKAVWDRCKDSWKKLAATMSGDSASLMNGLRLSRAPLEKLIELIFALDENYSERKRRAGVIDFSDAEHKCVRLLTEEDGSPTEMARILSAGYTEVMVDEYQDINAVQEMIFTSLSDKGRKLFTVGDVKQSIYRFRLADPSLFLARYRLFTENNWPGKVLLRENFRSSGRVLDAVNTVFDGIMSRDFGGVDYDEEARLVRGSILYDDSRIPKPELCVLRYAQEDDELPDKTRAEARYVAARIRDMVQNRELITDGDSLRPVEYRDIAVLLRTPNTTGAAFRRALTEAGVTVAEGQGGSFFEQEEIRFVTAMLAVIDNPLQDVPLVAALRGLPFGFTPEELASLRTESGTRRAGEEDCGDGSCCLLSPASEDRRTVPLSSGAPAPLSPQSLWPLLRRRAVANGRCAAFVRIVEELRDLAVDLPTDELLRRLYDRTDLLSVCAALPDGETRTANLMTLYEYAARFEKDGFRGLFLFVRHLKGMMERGIEPPAGGAENAVRIMSIHKSKGLEFPVVFLAETAHQWKTAGTGTVLCHGELGFGMKITDNIRGVEYPTVSWRAIAAQQRREEKEEQVRVLYVAMTRAKERLIMSCVLKDPDKTLAALEDTVSPLSPRELLKASSPAAWLLPIACADGGRTIDLHIENTPNNGKMETRSVEYPAAPAVPTLELRSAAERYLGPERKQDISELLPSKITATQTASLCREEGEEETVELVPKTRDYRLPEPGGGTRPLTGRERGIAAHLVMQHIDLSRTETLEEIAEEIRRLREAGFLDERQAASVQPDTIRAFFASSLGQRVLRADDLRREFRFSLLCDARQWVPEAPAGEQILLQGVVDLCIEEQGVLTIIDFKTDNQEEPERYRGQMEAYALAMRRVLNKPVATAELWYLRKKTGKTLAFEEKVW